MNACAPSTDVSRDRAPANVASVPVDPQLARDLTTAGKKADDWKLRRDALVIEAHGQGASLREIAKLVGLSNPGVLRIIRKYHAPTGISIKDEEKWR